MTVGVAAHADESVICTVHWRASGLRPALPALSQVVSRLHAPSILGGNQAKVDADGFSYWAAEPREVFEFCTDESDPFGRLQKALGRYTLNKNHPEPPKGMFVGGWIGYFSYELGRYIDSAVDAPARAVDDIGMPLIRLCFYDRSIAYDHAQGVFHLVALELPGDSQTPEQKLDSLEGLLSKAQDIGLPRPATASLGEVDFSDIRCNMTKDHFMRMLKKVRRHIYDGDVYQINFSQRFEQHFSGHAIDFYHWQNHYNPAPYAAYIDTGGFKVVSTSPELFVRIEDGLIETKPIKGTRPRISEKSACDQQAREINRRNFNELIESEKEQAELNMIIDLERNDIARICEPGTRSVLQGRTIETYATVFHAVATVGGRLRPRTTLSDILRAMFPGGSITGAPKIRSMEIIDEIEPTARGLYTGSIGYIGLDGNVCLNIAIRTAIISGDKAYVQTGSGIVADSDPQAEWDETITKAKALLAGIRATQKSRHRIVDAPRRSTKAESRNPESAKGGR